MSMHEAAVVSVFIGAVVAGSTWIFLAFLDNMLALKKRMGNRKDAQAPPPEP